MRTLRGFAVLLFCTTAGCATVNEVTLGVRLHVTPPPEPERSDTTARWVDAVKGVAKTGDWLVVRAYTPADDAVVLATNIPLSHAAVFDAEKGEVVEARWAGVSTRALDEFLDHAHRVLVIRPKWWTVESGQAAASFATSLIGSQYDFGGLVGIGSKDRFYCSELAVQVYRESFRDEEHVPRVVEPGQMYLWGSVLFDSGFRN
jgi:hypothetical protein